MSFLKSLQIYNGGALLLALWLAGRLIPGAAMPVAGWGVAVVAYLFAPARIRHASPVRGDLAHLAPALAMVGLAMFAADVVFLDLKWTNYAFLPAWIVLVMVSWLRFVPWREAWLYLVRWQQSWLSREVLLPPLYAFANRRRAAHDDLACSGAMLVAAVGWLAGSLAPALRLPTGAWIFTAALWLAIDRWPWRRWQDGTTGAERLARLFGRLVLWTFLAAGWAVATLPTGPTRGWLAWVVACNVGLIIFGLSQSKGLADGAENLRRSVILAFALGLMHPFATNIPRGAGDAVWYARTVADTLAQTRAGVFPVFVGQSEFLFNGGIYPLRLAPLLQHYAIAADLLTLGSLEPSAVLNLVLILTFLAASLFAYLMLGSLLPGRRWLAAGLAILYLTCPGILALVYGFDLYMTWSILPWIPVAFGGCVRSFRDPGLRPLLEMAVGLGLAWWAHAPVALWATLIISAIQAVRLTAQGLRTLDWRRLLAAAAAFSVLALYPLVSVLAVPLEPGTPNVSYPAAAGAIVEYARQAFPGIFLPLVDGETRSLADFQAGWALLLLIIMSLLHAGRCRIRSLEYWSLIAAALALSFLLLPLPGLNLLLWSLLPGAILNATGLWAMQRFYLLIAACVVFAAAALLGLPGDRLSRFSRWCGWLLSFAIAWSTLEASTFLRVAWQVRLKHAHHYAAYNRPENYYLTRYAYGFFPNLPAYFSHGYVDPQLEQRLLARESRQVLLGNTDAITASPAIGRMLDTGTLAGRREGDGPGWQFEPVFRVEPGRRYLLEFDFLQPEANGVLVVDGHTLARVYALPVYGEPLSFGAAAGASKSLPLYTSSATAGDVRLQFILKETPVSRDLTGFARYRWLEYAPETLPVHVTGWIPYQARVQSPADAWLETSRMFQQGYRARVNGHDVVPTKSPQGLVMLPVPAGQSQVTLSYHPPLLLASTYYVSLGGFVVVFGLLVHRWRKAGPPE